MRQLNYTQRLAIREWYSGEFSSDIYQFPWLDYLTPIERSVLDQLRIDGTWPMWPQYPVGPYWVDFGNPEYRIAIECDGKRYHQLDDNKRDIYLESRGWIVFHLTGRQCHQNNTMDDFKSIESMIDWERGAGINGLSQFLRRTIFNGQARGDFIEELSKWMKDEAILSRFSAPQMSG